MGFPQLIEEDFQRMDATLRDLLARSEATAVLLVEKAGHLIHQCGQTDLFPPDVLATLASNSFNAVQFMAGLLNEAQFPGLYQQGAQHSTLMMNVDEHCLLVIIFPSQLSVGAIRFYAGPAIRNLATQIKTAEQRAPSVHFDLTDLNVSDVQGLFRRAEPAAEASAPSAPPAPEPAPAPPPPAPAAPAEPIAAKRGPFVEAVLPGTYYWCACGRSASQPFCDGAHKGTGLKPLPVEIDSIRQLAFCGCKRTQTPPFCDGKHACEG